MALDCGGGYCSGTQRGSRLISRANVVPSRDCDAGWCDGGDEPRLTSCGSPSASGLGFFILQNPASCGARNTRGRSPVFVTVRVSSNPGSKSALISSAQTTFLGGKDQDQPCLSTRIRAQDFESGHRGVVSADGAHAPSAPGTRTCDEGAGNTRTDTPTLRGGVQWGVI